MRPLDPRLLRYASAARVFLVTGAALALAQTLTVTAFAWLLSHSIVLAVQGRTPDELAPTARALAGAVVVRAALVWLTDVVASRGAARVKSQLRRLVLDRVAELGPDWLAGRQGARVTTVVTGGLDALDNYFARYLPQLLASVIATPLLVALIFWQDAASAITIIVTLPLIPVFMVLIGWATQAAQRQQWEALQGLSSGFLDLVGGLGTLTIYGREKRQGDRLRALTEEYRARTMKVLRVSFLSGFALEMAASLAVAIVAVSIGLRLVDGSLAFGVGLFVLLLAPEAFLPVRQVGVQFHAAADGLAAAEEVFAILADQPHTGVRVAAASHGPSTAVERPAGRPEAGAVLRFDDVSIRRGDAVAVSGFNAEFKPGELAVLTGPSGAGKSTLMAALLGFVPHDGRITLGAQSVGSGTGSGREWLAWAGQRPGLFAGTVDSNVALGASPADPALVHRALEWAGIPDLDPANRLGVNGEGLSGGQAQRVAAARAIYRALDRGCPVVVFDEPSSALDDVAENALLRGLRHLAAEGRVVIAISHRPSLAAAADHVVDVREAARV